MLLLVEGEVVFSRRILVDIKVVLSDGRPEILITSVEAKYSIVN